MKKIAPDEFMVMYNDELGVVYASPKVVVKTTTPEHAQAIESCFNQYFSDKMTEQEQEDFEEYMERSFRDTENLPVVSEPDLLKRDTLHRLEVVVANDCNLRCRYCYAYGGSYGMPAQRMSPETAERYLEKLLIGRYRGVKTVTFFGGEPTLCPDTIQAICEFFEENVEKEIFDETPQFLMVSNGTLIDERMAKLIHRYNIGVTISIDGPMEINDLNRVDSDGKGTFSRIARGIDMLNQVGSPPVLLEATYTMLHKELGYSWNGIRDYIKEQFHTENVMVAECSDGGIEDGLAYENWDPHVEDIGKAPFPNIEFTAKRLAAKEISDIGCDVAYGSIALLPNGEIYPCHFFINHPEYKIADFCDGNFDFSGYSRVLSYFEGIRKSQSTRCKECWAKAVCSACPAQFLLQKERETDIAATCHITRTQQAHLILECAKINQAE